MKCKLCGQKVVEVSMVPRAVEVDAEDEYGEDRIYIEDEAVIGYGCQNYQCENWQGDMHLIYDSEAGEYRIPIGASLESVGEADG